MPTHQHCAQDDLVLHNLFKKNHFFTEQVKLRFTTLWGLKAVGTMVFMMIFFSGYLALLHHPWFPVTIMSTTRIDDWIRFNPKFLVLYVSLWVYVSLPPALLLTQQELISYGGYIALVCLIGLFIFLVYPTATPPSSVDWSSFPRIAHLKSVDMAGNAFPSLHVATAFFSALWLDYLLQQMHSEKYLRIFNVVWCAGIIYSTIAIKQHVFFDVLAGMILGGGVAVISLRKIASFAMKK